MLTNQRLFILIVGVIGAMTAFALASQDYALQPGTRYALGVINAGVLALLAALKSWGDSGDPTAHG